LAELHRGVYRLCSGRRRDALHDWVKTDLVARFDQRILTVNGDVAVAWGRLMVKAE